MATRSFRLKPFVNTSCLGSQGCPYPLWSLSLLCLCASCVNVYTPPCCTPIALHLSDIYLLKSKPIKQSIIIEHPCEKSTKEGNCSARNRIMRVKNILKELPSRQSTSYSAFYLWGGTVFVCLFLTSLCQVSTPHPYPHLLQGGTLIHPCAF